MAQQTRLLAALVEGLNQPRQQPQGLPNKIAEFVRIKPPIFAGSNNPMDVDDWLRIIQRKINAINCMGRDRVLLTSHQLSGTALAWWENYCEAANDAAAITWEEFVEEFRWHHVPEGAMELKADEFRNLKQGSMFVNEYIGKFVELSRYAPEEVSTDKKKQTQFKKV